MNKPSILIIYTGGTIGMVQKPETGSLAPVKWDQIVEEVPELMKFGYQIDTYNFNPPIDSSDMTPVVWTKIARTIKRNYNKYDGFVVLHGTDTMSYTASALSFMLENLDKPIIFTGSQLPVGMIRTDGKENLITAVEIAAAKRKDGSSMVPEVCVYFDFQLFRGNRTTKRDSEQFSAFGSENYPTLAKAGIDIVYNSEFINYPKNKGILKVNSNFNDQVGILKIFPGMNKEIITSILETPNIKGWVLESFGSGNVPTSRWFLNAIKRIIKRGVMVLNVTQCEGGKVNMGHYETSRELQEVGVISGNDITTEAAITKLMFLLGQGLSTSEIQIYLNKSLNGEISE
ncbi:asparaginase [Prolixibacteraceae bacterium JC049]|nr:asparaginase [Prolixibacteraceae bacterium JC049]